MRLLLALSFAAGGVAQSGVPPQTTAERSGFTQTSTHAEVLAFLSALEKHPRAARLRVETFGRSAGGKPLVVAFAGEPLPAADALHRSPKLRVLVNANIHGGEVEGKEVSQVLVRELLEGAHDDLLAACDFAFVPDFNPDGNDRIDKKNRVDQNGPEGGVGRRENGDGLDLNRDFVKLETSECRALVALLRRFDPHVFFDLHTTDGSHHGYHVTYARSLAVNLDPAIAAVSDALLAKAREELAAKHGVRAFEFGDFARIDGQRCWQTFDHLPRFATNYVGLHNRVAVLCEAYSHAAFEVRVKATRAFVLEVVRAAVARKEAIVQACAEADLRPSGKERIAFGFASRFADCGEGEVLVGSCERVAIEGVGTRLVAKPEFTKETMRLRTRFEATKWRDLPAAWALIGVSEVTLATLRAHGIALERQDKDEEVEVDSFVPTAIERSKRSFQKHLPTTFEGIWRRTKVTLPVGTWRVSATQPKARLAAQLLEPDSEDSLATWNHFDALARVFGTEGAADVGSLSYPVARVAPAGAGSSVRAVDPRMETRIQLTANRDQVQRYVNGAEAKDEEAFARLLTEALQLRAEKQPGVVIDAAAGVSWTAVLDVMNAVKQRGIDKIEFAMGEERRGSQTTSRPAK